MSQPFELINKVQRFVIDHANKEGVNLHSEFESIDQFKHFIVALTVKGLMDLGFTCEAALDMALGEGTYAKIAEECWNTIEAKSVTVA
jgi:hypothetical protein